MEKVIRLKLNKIKKSKLDCILRWIAATFGVLAALFTGSAVIHYQVYGWSFAIISSSCWLYAATVDSDKPRILMNIFYVVWCIVAVYNWIKF